MVDRLKKDKKTLFILLLALVIAVGIVGFDRIFGAQAIAAGTAVTDEAAPTPAPLMETSLTGKLNASDLNLESLVALSGYQAPVYTPPVVTPPPAPVAPAPKPAGSATLAAPKGTSAEALVAVNKDFAFWRGYNPDVKAWLRVPTTNINYPVTWNPDTSYYLHLGYDKKANHYGVLWADGDTRFGTRDQISVNTVIYGHNWVNCRAPVGVQRPSDKMYEQLAGYANINQARANQLIYYSTADQGDMVFIIFACFYTDISFYYNRSDPNPSQLQAIIDSAKARSEFIFSTDVNNTDKIITLSTCTRVKHPTSDRQRFVVMGRLLRPNEAIPSVTVAVNPSPVQPKLP